MTKWWFSLFCCLLGPAASSGPEDPPAAAPLPLAGLHNVYQITEKLYSGSSPEGEEGFRSLQRIGVKTVISVDGAKPDTELAHKYGLCYVHLPIGYDGVPRDQAVRLAKAVRDLPGAVYLHCHHGKHRGPAAAAVVHLCLDEKCTVEAAIAEMRRAGTDPRYVGLYAAPKELGRPSTEELDKVSSDFPEVATVPQLAQIMVAVDQQWDNLTLAKAAGWKKPPDHPDIDPAHEALQLLEHYREASRLPATADRRDDFRRLLAEAENSTTKLEQALRAADRGTMLDVPSADKLFRKAGAACTDCHAKYRDAPRRP
jgi:protein tyrosine phosphatase (PTP) superfamily phosphohydrolase (DUF442 family)